MSEGKIGPSIGPVLRFLPCRTPARWAERALTELDTLLLDHASLELKAAQAAQKLIWKYGTGERRRGPELGDDFRLGLVHRMSRLAREELRHFEQVLAQLQRRGRVFAAVSPSPYAAGLHALARASEPGALVDALIIGAVIEARSCERFFSLLEPLGRAEPELAAFYASLLRSEARHFEDYLALARQAAADDPLARIEAFLARDAELVAAAAAELRFLGGTPGRASPRR